MIARLSAAGLLALAACTVAQDPPVVDDPISEGAGTDAKADLAVATKLRLASTVAAVKKSAPAAGAYRLHDIDVGTGLSILLQGHGWTALYDGGSGDDDGSITQTNGNTNRLLAYLFAALGPSGPLDCIPKGDAAFATYAGNKHVRIDHLFLSHPHLDHGSLLDDVLHCYDVVNVWDSGAPNDAAFYVSFLRAVAAEPGVRYHTAAPIPANRTLTIAGQTIVMPASVAWSNFDDATQVSLDPVSSFRLLTADGLRHPDANQNSLVVRWDLGAASVLLTGDAESGPRKPPASPAGDVEARLLQKFKAQLHVDVLQVGHHGSETSSRTTFLQAVSPKYAFIGAGPKAYAGVVLPDADIIGALIGLKATLVRTDTHDRASCPGAPDRIGVDDASPGGCDNWILDLPAPATGPKGIRTGHVSSTCGGRCGVTGGLCACDGACKLRGDCCADVCNACGSQSQCARPLQSPPPPPPSCANFCGHAYAQGCACDTLCASRGDCCFDVCAACTTFPFCAHHDDDPFAGP